MSDRILNITAVMAKVGLSRVTIYRHIKAGSFPKQIKLGPARSGWSEQEIDAWIEEQKTARAA